LADTAETTRLWRHAGRGQTPPAAERLASVVKALTGVKPKISRRSDGAMEVVCSWTHLEGFKRHAELAETVEVAGGDWSASLFLDFLSL
jgi:hypothetical protein